MLFRITVPSGLRRLLEQDCHEKTATVIRLNPQETGEKDLNPHSLGSDPGDDIAEDSLSLPLCTRLWYPPLKSGKKNDRIHWIFLPQGDIIAEITGRHLQRRDGL